MLAVMASTMRERLLRGEAALISAMVRSSRVFPAKSMIVEEGRQPTHVFHMTSGRAVRHRVLVDGRIQLLSVLLAGDFFGVGSLLGGVLTESIVAVTDVSVQSASCSEVLRLADQDADVAFWLIWYSNQNSQNIERWLTVLAQGTALEKIAFSLLDLWQRTDHAGRGPIRLPLSQRELSELVGITLPHVCRTVAILREAGAIDVHYGSIEIVRPELLAGYTQGVLGFLDNGNKNQVLNLIEEIDKNA
jgi:CRP-like cAMP-binding protein